MVFVRIVRTKSKVGKKGKEIVRVRKNDTYRSTVFSSENYQKVHISDFFKPKKGITVWKHTSLFP